MKVLIIPEDFRKDQYILKPLFQRLFKELGRGSARVTVCQNPLLGGIDAALNSERLADILNLYKMVDIFVLCVDRDGVEGRRQRLDAIEEEFGNHTTFLAESLPPREVLPMPPEAAAGHWGRQPRVASTPSAGSAPRTSMPSLGGWKPMWPPADLLR